MTGLSHEFRTPLNTIIGASEVIAQEMFGPLGIARYKSYAEDVSEAGHQLGNLANQSPVKNPERLEASVVGGDLK